MTALLASGVHSSTTAVVRKLHRGIENGTIRRVKVMRINMNGVNRPVDAYILKHD